MNVVEDTILGWLREQSVVATLIDADDTIWHDSRYFRTFENAILRETMAAGVVEQVIKERLHQFQQLYGSGERGFAMAARKVVLEFCGSATTTMQEACNLFLRHPVEVLPDAQETLRRLSFARRILLTKGNNNEQRQKLAKSQLSDHFDEVIILNRKSTADFALVLNGLNLLPQAVLVIGNSIRHDIIPAIENGARAIWLNHEENSYGRNAPLPSGVVEVADWCSILSAVARFVP